jgi:hypothetical protein
MPQIMFHVKHIPAAKKAADTVPRGTFFLAVFRLLGV